MKTKDVNGVCLVDIEENAISPAVIAYLRQIYAQKGLKKRIGINLKNVVAVKHDFFDFLMSVSEKEKFSLFNIPNDIYLMLFVSRYDKYVDMYLDERDFICAKNGIVYRRLKLLKTA